MKDGSYLNLNETLFAECERKNNVKELNELNEDLIVVAYSFGFGELAMLYGNGRTSK